MMYAINTSVQRNKAHPHVSQGQESKQSLCCSLAPPPSPSTKKKLVGKDMRGEWYTGETAQRLRHWLFLQRTRTQFTAPTQQLKTTCNSSSKSIPYPLLTSKSIRHTHKVHMYLRTWRQKD